MEFAFDHPLPTSTLNSHPYSSSLASSASSSSSSIFSLDGASSQASTCSTSSSVSSSLHVVWETDASQSDCTRPKGGIAPKPQDCPLPAEERLHPRRTNRCVQDTRACPAVGASRTPSLVRQSDRKNLFVEGLVDCSAQMVEVIWPTSAVPHLRNEAGGKGVLPLKTFIQETLRRSRTSYSTLQVALYYLILIQPHVPKYDFTMEQPEDSQSFRALQCGRRMFLSALILASKYLQDRNYSSRAWSKISGLNSHEINSNEMTFLFAINWQLHISELVFARWTDLVLKMTNNPATPSPPASPLSLRQSWASVLPRLTPSLSYVQLDQQHQDSLSLPPPPYASRHQSFNATPIPSLNTTPTQNHSYVAAPPPPPPPRVLEPSTQPTPPPTTLPRLISLGTLPTPQLTPQSTGFSTPISRRSSLGAAFDAAACSARPSSPPPSRNCSPPHMPFSLTSSCRKRTPSLLSASRPGDATSGRSLMQPDHPPLVLGRGGILQDRNLVLSPVTMAESSVPIQVRVENGRKRRCCGEEARMGRRVRQGPGMWKGIL